MAQREELEAKIKERRLAEATKKGLMGASGKIGAVLKALGTSVVSQTNDVSYIDTQGVEQISSDNPLSQIPVMDMEGVERPKGSEWSDEIPDSVSFGMHYVGRHFDGLSRGMHLEILYKDESSEMSVYYKGYLVYREIQGDLVCYVPIPEWEDWISSLFKLAKKIQRDEKEEEFKAKVQEAERNKSSWLRSIASRWGIT